MKAISGHIFDLWNAGGPFIGDEGKPQTRVTVQLGWSLQASQGAVGTWPATKLPVRFFTQVGGQVETEIPNMVKFHRSHSIDQDAATCEITLLNTSMLPQGLAELGNPGWMSWTRGTAGNRWGHAPNAWTNVLRPNALLRSYEGFGGQTKALFDALNSGNLAQTGTWLVDDVVVNTDGTVSIKCRDMAKLLIDQQCYPPLIPPPVYPLHYQRYYTRDVSSPGVPYGGTANHARNVAGAEVDENGDGYWIVGDDGGVFTYGNNFFWGSYGNQFTHAVVGIAKSSTGSAYWIALKTGQVFAFGNQPVLGSALARPTDFVAIEFGSPSATPDSEMNQGYYLLDAAGEVYTFGAAQYYGGSPTFPAGANAVAMAVRPQGDGYWLLNNLGQVYTFGATQFYGNIPPQDPSAVAISSTPSGNGYLITDTMGHVFAFGDAHYFGGTSNIQLNDPIVEILVPGAPAGTSAAATVGNTGYWLVAMDGGVFTFGSLPFYGSLPGGSAAMFPYDGNFRDYADIVKDLLLWSGFWFGYMLNPDGSPSVYGNIESTGAWPSIGTGDMPDDIFDKKPVIDPINKIKEIVGYVCWVDAQGGFHFEAPNWWGPGNFLSTGVHTPYIPVIDESVNLVTYGLSRNDRSARSQVIVSSEDPYPSVPGGTVPPGTVTSWSVPPDAAVLAGIVKPMLFGNETFIDPHEQDVMAQLIGLQIWFQERLGQCEAVANPLLDPGDQVQIFERQSEEMWVHYVRGIDVSHDLKTGEYRMQLTTHWLGSSSNWSVVIPT